MRMMVLSNGCYLPHRSQNLHSVLGRERLLIVQPRKEGEDLVILKQSLYKAPCTNCILEPSSSVILRLAWST